MRSNFSKVFKMVQNRMDRPQCLRYWRLGWAGRRGRSLQ
jgi:hypothetical protein